MMWPLSWDWGEEAETAAPSTVTGFPPKAWVLKAFCSCLFPQEGGGAQWETTPW